MWLLGQLLPQYTLYTLYRFVYSHEVGLCCFSSLCPDVFYPHCCFYIQLLTGSQKITFTVYVVMHSMWCPFCAVLSGQLVNLKALSLGRKNLFVAKKEKECEWKKKRNRENEKSPFSWRELSHWSRVSSGFSWLERLLCKMAVFLHRRCWWQKHLRSPVSRRGNYPTSPISHCPWFCDSLYMLGMCVCDYITSLFPRSATQQALSITLSLHLFLSL